jgi:hypothetical protein
MALSPENAASAETPGNWTKRIVFVACLLLTAGLVVAVYLGNEKKQQQLVTWDALSFTSLPPLDASEFLKEVQRAGGWKDSIDIADPAFLERLQRVCSEHPRVALVRSISLVSPQRIQLDLQFRKPVARLRGTPKMGVTPGKWYLIDREAYLLEPLPGESLDNFLELAGWEGLWPLDEPGKGWVMAAARLAELMKKDREAWSLESIVLVRQPVLGSELRLQTRDKRQIIWQTLDNAGQPEPAEEEKLNRLRAYFAQYGEIPAGKMLDMRSKEGIRRLDRSP